MHKFFLIAMISLGLAKVGTIQAADGKAKPNVLFIAVDDLRPEMGCYGNKVVKTPNLDRLAQRGIVFNRAYCQQAVCSPSRSSLLTGKRPDATQVWDLQTHFRVALPNTITLPQHFKANGYHTAALSKIYLVLRTALRGVNRTGIPMAGQSTLIHPIRPNESPSHTARVLKKMPMQRPMETKTNRLQRGKSLARLFPPLKSAQKVMMNFPMASPARKPLNDFITSSHGANRFFLLLVS